ncbi:hypothetical protein [Nocardiopsis valliformis]|uniref:hypothetical protein n=1 Tax=Nocardiopsis valliformis TaxID=239974 RepID=UPI00034D3CF1|nr:hypothetical protein [Nocardiopsis valliformis]
MTCSRLTLGALALALLIPLTSCGLVRDAGDSAQTQTDATDVSEETPESADEPDLEDLLPFMEAAMVSDTPEGIESGLQYAQPGSAAHEYLLFQADHLRANIYEGGDRSGNDVELSGDHFRVCSSQGCSTFDGFVFEGDLVSDFEVNSNAVSDYMYPGGSEFSQDGASITVARSYYSVESNLLAVILHGEADPGVSFEVMLPNYYAPDGERALTFYPEQTTGQESYGSGESGVLVYRYPDVEPGGHMSMYVSCDEGCDFLEDIELQLS